MGDKDFNLDDFDCNYDFIKTNYPLSSNLLFQQHMYNNRAKLKDYLKNFIRNKAEEPLRSLDLYFRGKKDLCIQSIELDGMHQDFKNDSELYTFLSSMMFSKKELSNNESLFSYSSQENDKIKKKGNKRKKKKEFIFSLDKKDFSGLTISILKPSLIKQQHP